MLISFEGIDGSGKSTNIRNLCQYLEEKGYDVQVFREPGGTVLSEQIREILLNSDEDIHPIAESLLFSAARAQLVATRIRPALAEGTIVIVDRFFDSTTAYQGYGREVIPVWQIDQLNDLATQQLEPDITFYLRLPPEEAQRRRAREGSEDRLERSGEKFFERVSKGFDQLAAEKERIITLDSTQPVEILTEQIVSHLRPKLDRL
ncbi:dTMP kinase [Natronogracilivirga saccharolytica]|uniref:Thymidylate kinase n=1 Tax=Natronogracilivirga saccharolytica TaxID=2812953 RepID=A0A8J7RT12_9BACT|nr:dTMP kinase [Natronogracilivirga saccharolytica]MBP3192432.1 dTMP kinase [Natronogracilivirga saccharolytica]